ncbi:MAG: SIR2 family protein [Candidatus Peribacteraceae bacterium]|nr:SIR2 family protein [Candidatus Peribacteraceae bacterium]
MITLGTGELRDTIQDCHVNFLIGAGMSMPYLDTLGAIEELLSQLEKESIAEDKKKIIRASLYKKYFDDVISKNMEILSGAGGHDVFESYKQFLNVINALLLHRKITLLSKQINIFTTNIDLYIEKALEEGGFENNDGFNGRFKPCFDLGNFKKSLSRRSLHFDNISELPMFNLVKLHGSLTWELDDDKETIKFCRDLGLVQGVKDVALAATDAITIPNTPKPTIASLSAAAASTRANGSIDTFMEAYEKLMIVNPTKEKFMHTVLNQTYYELLRIYSNELEKENTVLFVMGFSFADEHIRKMTLRAANSNPTLKIYIFNRSSDSAKRFLDRFDNFKAAKNNNIKLVVPPKKKAEEGEPEEDEFEYTLGTINEHVFDKLLNEVSEKEEKIPTTEHEEQ